MKLLEDRYRGKNGVSLFCIVDPERPETAPFTEVVDWAQEFSLACPHAYGFDNKRELLHMHMFQNDYNVQTQPSQPSWFVIIDPEGRVAFNYNNGPGKTAEEQAENLAAMIDALVAGCK